MSDQPFTIHVDLRRLYVKTTLSGHWDVATVDRYASAVQAAFSELTDTGLPLDRCKALIDLRQHGIQSREVAERVQKWIDLALSDGARHAVLVSKSALHRMQAQRVGSTLGAGFFSDEPQALHWLFEDEAVQQR